MRDSVRNTGTGHAEELYELVHLVVEQGLNYSAAARHLQVSPATVTRMMKRAKVDGLVKVVANLPRHVQLRFHSDQQSRIREWVLQRDITNLLELIVVDFRAANADDVVQWGESVRHFGRCVGPYLGNRLRGCRQVGVGWGRTLLSVVEALPAVQRPATRPVSFFPLWGEPFGPRMTVRKDQTFAQRDALSASNLARRFASMLVPERADQTPSLLGVPGIVPLCEEETTNERKQARRDQARLKTITDFVKSWSAYEVVFGSETRRHRGLADTMDTALVAIGSPEHPQRFWSEEFLAQGRIDRKLLIRGVLGDIGGVLIPKPDDESTAPAIRQAIQYARRVGEHWLGVKESHLQQCADKTRKSSVGLGVVALAVGEERGRTLFDLLPTGLINRVILDQTAFQALCAHVVQALDSFPQSSAPKRITAEQQRSRNDELKFESIPGIRGDVVNERPELT